MNRRVKLSKVTISKVMVPGVGEVSDKGVMFDELCGNKAWADIACMLVESRSVNVNSLYRFGEHDISPLVFAALYGRLDVAGACIKAGAGVDKVMDNGVTSLHAASEEGHVDVARLLVDSGADLDKTVDDGSTAVSAARWMGHSAIVKLLLDAGATK